MEINDFKEIDQWIIGNYWVNSEIENLNQKLSISPIIKTTQLILVVPITQLIQ